MNNDRSVRLFEAWLESEAPTRAPEGLLDRIDKTTGAIRPRPAWLARLEGHHMQTIEGGRRTGIPRLGLVIATVALLAALAGAAIFVGGSRPQTVITPPVAPTSSPAGPTASPARTPQMRPIEPGELIPEALLGDWVAYEFGEYAYYRRAGDPWCVEYWGTSQDCVSWHDGEEVKGDANIVTLVDGQLRFVTIGTTFCAGEANLVDFAIEGDEVTLTVLPGQCFTDMSNLRRVQQGQVYPTLPPP